MVRLVPQVSPPGSVVDAGDGVKVPSAQRQRRYNTSPSQRLIFESEDAPCSPEQGVEVKICEYSNDDNENLTIPVFTISEEDDREPLVSGERYDQAKNNKIVNRESFPSLGSAHSAFTDEVSAVLKNTPGKIRLPSLSHVTVPCDSWGKDMWATEIA